MLLCVGGVNVNKHSITRCSLGTQTTTESQTTEGTVTVIVAVATVTVTVTVTSQYSNIGSELVFIKKSYVGL